MHLRLTRLLEEEEALTHVDVRQGRERAQVDALALVDRWVPRTRLHSRGEVVHRRVPSRDGRTSRARRRCSLGRRGPAPMPTELKVLHGERRPCRLNRNAPKAKNVPVMPEGMSEPAQAIWNRLTRDYAHTGVLTSVDTDALQIYCEAVTRYRHGAKMLEQSGPLVRGSRRGDLVKNPLHQVVRDDADLIR